MKRTRLWDVQAYVTKVRIEKLVAALALGAATLLPAMAAAQGRSDHGGQHDNGQHRGSDRDRGDQGRQDRDRRDNDRHDNDRNRHDWDRDRRVTNRYDDHRQTSKNNWRNLGVLGGAVGVAGLLTGNRTVAALGLGGGLYSAYRYEQDRKSQNRDDRGRYELFRRTSFDHQGHHYVRRERTRDGQKYYYFQRQR